MKLIVKDLKKRELIKQELINKFAEIAAKTNTPEAVDQWKPTPEYPFYVVYLKEVGGPYVVGFESILQACLLVLELKQKPDTDDASICESYPWEVMVSGNSKKSNKQKPKPQKHKPKDV